MSEILLKTIGLPASVIWQGSNVVAKVTLPDGTTAQTEMCDRIIFKRRGRYFDLVNDCVEPAVGSEVTICDFKEGTNTWVVDIGDEGLFMFEVGKPYMAKIEEAQTYFARFSLKFSELAILLAPIAFELTVQNKTIDEAFTHAVVMGLDSYSGSTNGAVEEEREQWFRLMILYGPKIADAIIGLRDTHKVELVGSVLEGKFIVDGTPIEEFLRGRPYIVVKQGDSGKSALSRLAGKGK